MPRTTLGVGCTSLSDLDFSEVGFFLSNLAIGVTIDGSVAGMAGTLSGLFFFHRRQREREREKRVQYWREQVSEGYFFFFYGKLFSRVIRL
jgi:hypothetical protein